MLGSCTCAVIGRTAEMFEKRLAISWTTGYGLFPPWRQTSPRDRFSISEWLRIRRELSSHPNRVRIKLYSCPDRWETVASSQVGWEQSLEHFSDEERAHKPFDVSSLPDKHSNFVGEC